MADLGFFQDQRVELIEGEIIQMPPQKDLHAAAMSLTSKAISRAFGQEYWVRSQLPLRLDADSEPEPDVAVVKGNERDYIGTGHPREALLVVEISDTTLRYDRGEKAALYASHGIADYWIVNLQQGNMEIYRDPLPDPLHRFGWRYGNTIVFTKADSIAPLAMPEASIRAADCLP